MKITVHELLALQDEARNAGREAERGVSLAKEEKISAEYGKRLFTAHEEGQRALTARMAEHRAELIETGEASFKAGVAQGREDAQRDCWHVVASILQELAKRPMPPFVRDALQEVAAMARNGTISDALEKTAASAPVE